MAFAALLTVGLICLVIAAALLYVGYAQRRSGTARRAATAVTVGDLVASPGPRRGLSKLVGTVQAGPEGPIISPVGNVSCAWARVIVVRKLNDQRGDPDTARSVNSSMTVGYRDLGEVVIADGNHAAAVDMSHIVPDSRWRMGNGPTVQSLGDPSLYLRGLREAAGNWRSDGFRQGEYAIKVGDTVQITGRLILVDGVITSDRPIALDRPFSGPTLDTSTRRPLIGIGWAVASVAVALLAISIFV